MSKNVFSPCNKVVKVVFMFGGAGRDKGSGGKIPFCKTTTTTTRHTYEVMFAVCCWLIKISGGVVIAPLTAL